MSRGPEEIFMVYTARVKPEDEGGKVTCYKQELSSEWDDWYRTRMEECFNAPSWDTASDF